MTMPYFMADLPVCGDGRSMSSCARDRGHCIRVERDGTDRKRLVVRQSPLPEYVRRRRVVHRHDAERWWLGEHFRGKPRAAGSLLRRLERHVAVARGDDDVRGGIIATMLRVGKGDRRSREPLEPVETWRGRPDRVVEHAVNHRRRRGTHRRDDRMMVRARRVDAAIRAGERRTRTRQCHAGKNGPSLHSPTFAELPVVVDDFADPLRDRRAGLPAYEKVEGCSSFPSPETARAVQDARERPKGKRPAPPPRRCGHGVRSYGIGVLGSRRGRPANAKRSTVPAPGHGERATRAATGTSSKRTRPLLLLRLFLLPLAELLLDPPLDLLAEFAVVEELRDPLADLVEPLGGD